MAYLKSFDHDVFISYARGDNVPDREGERGWVEQFAQELAIRLLKRFGEPVDIWRDPGLKRSHQRMFESAIEKAVQGSSIMIALITNRYLHSEYCQQEIKWFCEKAEQGPCGLIVDDHVRLFPVLLYNIPPESWPEACRGASAFPFHDASGPEFGEPLDPDSEAFSKQLRRLVDELHVVLRRLKEHEAAPTPDDADAVSDFTIFVASSSDDLRPIRRQMSKTLAQLGITVISDIPPPYDDASHAQAVTQAIQKADLCVHLMSTLPGEPLDPDNPSGTTFPLEQVRLGLEHARSQLILAPPEFAIADIEDAAFAAFMRELTERPWEAARLEFVRTGRHQMIDFIFLKKEVLQASKKLEWQGITVVGEAVPTPMSMGEIKYFFSYARKDTEFALKLAQKLRAAGVDLWLDQLDILGGQHWDLAIDKALKTCQGMIVILSPESVASYNVMDEVSCALEERKLVVPVLLRRCDIPFRLRRVQYIDYTVDDELRFHHLLRSCQKSA